MIRAWTPNDVLALPVTVDIVTAGNACGIGRSLAYELQRRGEFPVPVLRLGCRYRVRRSDLVAFLGVAPSTSGGHAA